jgi:hypothetical protein
VLQLINLATTLKSKKRQHRITAALQHFLTSNLQPFILIFFPSFETFYERRYALCAMRCAFC